MLWHDGSRTYIISFTGLDGLGHIIGFLFLCWLVHTWLKLSLVVTALTLTLYAALTELGQYYLGFRNGEFRDFIADVLGILLFVLLRWLYVVIVATRAKQRRAVAK